MRENKVARNASWIIACRIVQALFNLLISMLTARYLGPSDFGLINYAASVTAFAAPVMYLGFNSILVMELINKPEREGEILGTAITSSMCSAVLCICGITAFTMTANAGEVDTVIVCVLYSGALLFQALELIQYWFQAKLMSKYTSVTMLIAYVIVSAYKLVLLVTGRNVYWFAAAQAVDCFIIAAVLLVLYRKLGGKKLVFSKNTAVRLFSKSRYYIVSSMMVTVFAQTDRIMLKFIISDAATGYYSAAVTCAGMTGFVFAAIIDSARPAILESRAVSREMFEKNVSRLYCVIIYLSLLQCVGITVFANPIVRILYGTAFEASVSALRIIVWYTTFSYMGAVRNIWILAEGKQKYLWIIDLSGAGVNIVLNCFMIPAWGICGAAFASLITQVFTNAVLGFLLKPIRRNNTLMLRGASPVFLFENIHAHHR